MRRAGFEGELRGAGFVHQSVLLLFEIQIRIFFWAYIVNFS